MIPNAVQATTVVIESDPGTKRDPGTAVIEGMIRGKAIMTDTMHVVATVEEEGPQNDLEISETVEVVTENWAVIFENRNGI